MTSILKEANVGLTTLPSTSTTQRRGQRSHDDSLDDMNNVHDGHALNHPNFMLHPSRSATELLHLAQLLNGLDAIVLDLSGPRASRCAIDAASSLVDPLVPALSVPDQPALWRDKGKELDDNNNITDECQCGRGGSPASDKSVEEVPESGSRKSLCLAKVKSAETPAAATTTTEFSPLVLHRALTANCVKRVTSHPPSHPLSPPPEAILASPPLLPAAAPRIPHARIVLIMEPSADLNAVVGYFESLKFLTSEQITGKLVQPPTFSSSSPPSKIRSASPPRSMQTSSSAVHHSHSHSSSSRRSNSSNTFPATARGTEIVRIQARTLKPTILHPALVEHFLQPALLGGLDELHGVWFGMDRLDEMRRAVSLVE